MENIILKLAKGFNFQNLFNPGILIPFMNCAKKLKVKNMSKLFCAQAFKIMEM